MSSQAILDVAGLTTTFHVKRANKKYALKAVDHVSFQLGRGEILGFVGETGVWQDHGRSFNTEIDTA